MSRIYVKVHPTTIVKDAIELMHDNQQTCVLIIDHDDFLEGVLTLGDIRRKGFETSRELPSTPRGDTQISDVSTLGFMMLSLSNLCKHNLGNHQVALALPKYLLCIS